MNKYEAMFIIKPELSEEEKKALFSQITEAISKHGGEVSSAAIWSEKRKFFFPIKKYLEGVYYLMAFTLPPLAVKDIRHAYNLNENILRALISKLE
ncbi:MAG: 30S ribosomal protein S6 [Candidatus Omnitrophota bacterium]|jgi:small subunit ribosomal protein S6